VRGSDRMRTQLDEGGTVSIHAPVRGSDMICEKCDVGSNVSIHAPVRGSDLPLLDGQGVRPVSIHAPVRGSDWDTSRLSTALFRFNPRSRARERRRSGAGPSPRKRFQSTLPCEGATVIAAEGDRVLVVSIHAPVRGSDPICFVVLDEPPVSIHAPVRGSDPQYEWKSGDEGWFQSTLPCEGATGDIAADCGCKVFQSTLPCEGATQCVQKIEPGLLVSIHAPVRGSDLIHLAYPTSRRRFNPRSRARERRSAA